MFTPRYKGDFRMRMPAQHLGALLYNQIYLAMVAKNRAPTSPNLPVTNNHHPYTKAD